MIKLKKITNDLLEALKGSEQDFTEGSIKRAIFLLSIPMILEMLMESVFAIVDIFFVSKLGSDAVAAVGITESLMTIVYALSIGFSTATAAIISRRIGEKNTESAAVVAVQSIFISVFVSIFIALIGIFFATDLLKLMGASDSVVEMGKNYAIISLSSNVIIMLLFTINSVFRSSGDASIAMRVLLIANGINLILDPCLIFGLGFFPKFGVEGAAIATATGRGVGVVLQLYYLFFGNKRVKIKKEHIYFDFQIIKKIIKISFGGIAQSLIATSSWIFLVRIIATFGSVAVAGYTIALRILLFSILPSWGFSNSAATLTGQNLGAKQPERAEKSVWITALINFIYLSIVAILTIIFSKSLISLFISDLDVIEKGAEGLKFISCSLFAYSIGMVMIQAFNGSGKTQVPTIINLVSFWIIQIPLSYVLAIKTPLNEQGVYFAIIAGDLFLTLIGIILFKRGKWKLSIL